MRPDWPKKIIRLAPLASAMVLWGCGHSPDPHFFALAPVAPGRPPVAVGGPPIGLDRVRLPAILDRQELVRRGAGDSVIIDDRDRWAAPLDDMALRVLGQDLAQRLPPGRFTEPGVPRRSGPRRSVVVTVQEFDVDSAGNVVLECAWVLLADPPGPMVVERHQRIERESAGSTQAEAMSAALAALADRIADGIATD